MLALRLARTAGAEAEVHQPLLQRGQDGQVAFMVMTMHQSHVVRRFQLYRVQRQAVRQVVAEGREIAADLVVGRAERMGITVPKTVMDRTLWVQPAQPGILV